MLCRRRSSALSSGESVGDTLVPAATERGELMSMGVVPLAVVVVSAAAAVVPRGVRGGREADVRGRESGVIASAPNWFSRMRKRRSRRVEGSAVRWGCEDLKRWERVS